MDLFLSDKKVLVLGSSSGLGFAVAKAYSDEGAEVAVVSRKIERATKASQLIKNSSAFQCDLQKKSAGFDIVKAVIEKFGRIDILITNTGGPPTGSFMDLKNEDWENGYNSLWMGAIESIRSALPGMIERKWGRILLITSVSAKESIPNLTISNSYRAGLLGVMKSLSREVAKYNITVNSILPGYTRTERLAELNISDEVLSESIPAGRIGEPEELASLAVYLSGKQASYITGQAIACDGGSLHGV